MLFLCLRLVTVLLLCLMVVTVLLLCLVVLTAMLLQVYRILTQQNDANRYNRWKKNSYLSGFCTSYPNINDDGVWICFQHLAATSLICACTKLNPAFCTRRHHIWESVLMSLLWKSSQTYPKYAAAKIFEFLAWDMHSLTRLWEFGFARLPSCVVTYYINIRWIAVYHEYCNKQFRQ